MKSIGNNIKKIRELKNFNQDYMARRLGISQPEYSRIENGRVKLDSDRLKKIASFLNVKVETLYNFNGDKSLE